MKKSYGRWFPLDHAGKIYPSYVSKEETATFRVAAMLYQVVDPQKLQRALDTIIKRFPSMSVAMRKGMFWYYLETNKKRLLVQEETQSPCSAIDPDANNGYYFRVLYFKRRIAIECFHALTDGYGALEFLKALLYAYITECGGSIIPDENVKLATDQPSKEELEDAFEQIYKEERRADQTKKKNLEACHIPGTTLKGGRIIVSHCRVNAKELNHIAKKRGSTITVFLTALLIKNINDYLVNKKKKLNQYIVVNVPVNLRRLYPSKTLRNFSYFIKVAVKPKINLELDVIIQQVNEQMKQGLRKSELGTKVSHNVAFEKNMVVRVLPLYLKDQLLKQVRKRSGKIGVTSVLTNPGIIKAPQGFKDYVEYFECVLYASQYQHINTAICSYEDQLVISLSRAMKEEEFVQRYVALLERETGLPIACYSNERRNKYVQYK